MRMRGDFHITAVGVEGTAGNKATNPFSELFVAINGLSQELNVN